MNQETPPFTRLTTVEEVLDWCAVPDLLEERVARIQASTKVFPTLKAYIKMAFSQMNDFGHLLPYAPQKPVSKTPNRQELSFEEFYIRYLGNVSGTALGSVQNKRGRWAQMSDYLEPRDFIFICAAIQGEFVYSNPRINELTLRLAYPDVFPNT